MMRHVIKHVQNRLMKGLFCLIEAGCVRVNGVRPAIVNNSQRGDLLIKKLRE
jgi:hypothetical protein